MEVARIDGAERPGHLVPRAVGRDGGLGHSLRQEGEDHGADQEQRGDGVVPTRIFAQIPDGKNHEHDERVERMLDEDQARDHAERAEERQQRDAGL